MVDEIDISSKFCIPSDIFPNQIICVIECEAVMSKTFRWLAVGYFARPSVTEWVVCRIRSVVQATSKTVLARHVTPMMTWWRNRFVSAVRRPVSRSHWPSVSFSICLFPDAEGGRSARSVNLRHGAERDGQRSDKFDMHVASSSECMSTVTTTMCVSVCAMSALIEAVPVARVAHRTMTSRWRHSHVADSLWQLRLKYREQTLSV